MTFPEGIQIATVLIAVASISISVASFRRNRRIELENSLYKIKLDAFSALSYEMEKCFVNLSSAIYHLKKFKLNKDQFDIKEVNKLSIEMEVIFYECNCLIAKSSVYFPEDIIRALRDFTNNLFQEFPDELPEALQANIDMMDKYFNEQALKANHANSLIRKNLNLEKLNHSLFKRSN